MIQEIEPLIGQILQQYGVTGLAFGTLLILILRQNKTAQTRVENLEKQQQEQYSRHIADQKETIEDYVTLVQSNTRVLSDLTNCLHAIKDTLERMERPK